MNKPRIYAEVIAGPDTEGARVVLRGMALKFKTPLLDVKQAGAIAAELNDRLEAGDLNELIKKGQMDAVRDHVFRRAIRYAATKALNRLRAGMGPLSTLAALTAGVGDLAVTATEAALIPSASQDGHLEDELFEAACQGAVVVIFECLILLHTWGIDARVVVGTFLDNMEGREPRAEDSDGAGVRYLHLVDKPEESN